MSRLTDAERKRISNHFICELWGRKQMRVFWDPLKRVIRVRAVFAKYNWPVPERCRPVGDVWQYPSSVMAFRAALNKTIRGV